MDRLYTPWRFAYVTGQIEEKGCVFCNRLECDEEAVFVLWRGRHWHLVLNRYPYNNGHLLLVLNRHQPALSRCTPEEMEEMGQVLPKLEAAIQRVFRPQGINCGYNGGESAGAGIPEHLHLHMLPRWSGDTSFMTTIGETRVMPQELAESYAQLKPVLDELLGDPA